MNWSAIVIFIEPERLKNMSVSLALMGFHHAKWSVAFEFSQTIYILWFHTWQDIQYSKKLNETVLILSESKKSLSGLYRLPLLVHNWRENAILWSWRLLKTNVISIGKSYNLLHSLIVNHRTCKLKKKPKNPNFPC